MKEISGFGGDYEDTCRKMLIAGIEWLDAHPDKAPIFKQNPDIFGLVKEDNAAAESLSAAIVDAAEGDATGAMHHAVIQHVMTVNQIGWDAYVQSMTHPQGEIGMLKDKLALAESNRNALQKQNECLNKEVIARGDIIADKVLGWQQYILPNGQQKAYAPDNDALENIGIGQSLSSLVDHEIDKLKEAEAA
jgi:hypothetical protein